jgi:transcription initiation factor IIE alpha subunit
MPEFIDEPLMIAHLLGGANGVDVHDIDLTDDEIARRVSIAVRYGREILKQLKEQKKADAR